MAEKEEVIKMDPDSKEWKDYLEKVNEQLRKKYNGELKENDDFGYRKK